MIHNLSKLKKLVITLVFILIIFAFVKCTDKENETYAIEQYELPTFSYEDMMPMEDEQKENEPELQTTNENTYTVLIVDASDGYSFDFTHAGLVISLIPRIYEVGCYLDKSQEAARKILPQIMSIENSHVAIVSFGSNAETVIDFTDSVDDAFTALDNIKIGDDGGNIESGLNLAGQLLDSVEGEKRILLCTSGCPVDGEYAESGFYSPDDSEVPANWENGETKIRLYQYANATINTAQSLKDKDVLISVVGVFSPIEEALPSDGKMLANFFRRIAKDIASSDEHLYTVEDFEYIDDAFEQYADDFILADYFSYYKAIKYKGHTYRIFDMPFSWKSANEYCKSVGGHLVTITSPEERDAVNKLLDQYDNSNNVWLGATISPFAAGYNLDTSEISKNVRWIDDEQASDTDFYIAEDKFVTNANYGYVSYIDADSKEWILIQNTLDNNTECEMSFVCEWDSEYESMFESPNLITMRKRYYHTCGNKEDEAYISFSWGTDLFDNGEMGSALRMPDYDLAIASLLLAHYAYDDNGTNDIETFMGELGFKEIKPKQAEINDPKTYYGYQEVTFRDGSTANLFLVDIRGTKEEIDMLTDASGVLFLLNDLVNNAESDLYAYINSATGKDREALKQENNIFWLTGHSLGAAVANRLSTNLSNEYGKGNVYTYTFESPHTYNVGDVKNAKTGTNTINYLNVDDMVVHLGLGQSTYGKNVYFSQHTDIDEEIFKIVTGGSGLESIRDVENSFNANHNLDIPLAYILKQKLIMEKQTLSDYVRCLVEIGCPVDVRLFVQDRLVGEVKQDKLLVYDTSLPIELFVVDDKKYILMDKDIASSIEIDAYDDGVMEYKVIKEDYFSEKWSTIIDIPSINLVKGQIFTTSIDTTGIDKLNYMDSTVSVFQTEKDGIQYEILRDGTLLSADGIIINEEPEIISDIINEQTEVLYDVMNEQSEVIKKKNEGNNINIDDVINKSLIIMLVISGVLVLITGVLIYKMKKDKNIK